MWKSHRSLFQRVAIFVRETVRLLMSKNHAQVENLWQHVAQVTKLKVENLWQHLPQVTT